MGETKKAWGIELAKAGLGCFATVLAALIGGVFLLVSANKTAKDPNVPIATPTPTQEAVCSTERA